MKKTLRILCMILSLTLLCASLAGCSAEKRRMEKVIGTCAGFDVLYEELRYVTLTYKDLMESTYGEGIWDTPESAENYRAELEETVWRVMLNNYAVLSACADHGGNPAEDMENDSIKSSVDDLIDEAIKACGGEDAFEAELKSTYMTEHFLRFTLTVAQLENELYYVLTDDLGLIETDTDKFMTWLEEGNCVYVQHVYVSNDAGEDKEANRAKAESVREQLLSGTDISELVGTVANEDMQNVTPYFIVRDVYTEVLETAAFSLTEVGDVSEVIDTGDGYYVMVRIAYDTPTLLAKVTALLNSYQWAKVESIVDTYKTDLKIELNEYGKTIDLLEIE